MIADHTWKAIRKKGLLPHIVLRDDYEKATIQGMGQAAALLASLPEIRPNINLLRLIHGMIFDEVTPWAGQLTKTNLITNGFVTANPADIEPLLEKTARTWEKRPDPCPPEIRTKYLAWLTARIMRIHPFVDGNKRTTLCLILCLATRELGPHLDTEKLAKNLAKVIPQTRKGNLQPLGELLLEASGNTVPPNMNWNLPSPINPLESVQPSQEIEP